MDLEPLGEALAGTLKRSQGPQDGQLAVLVSKDYGGITIDLFGPIYGLSFREQEQMKIRALDVEGILVIDPVTLLRCKLKNLANLPQEGRQDRRHVRILIHVVRCHLRKGLSAVEEGGIEAKRFKREVKLVLSLETDRTCRKGMEMASISLSDAIPWQEFEKTNVDLLQRFLQGTLSRIRRDAH